MVRIKLHPVSLVLALVLSSLFIGAAHADPANDRTVAFLRGSLEAADAKLESLMEEYKEQMVAQLSTAEAYQKALSQGDILGAVLENTALKEYHSRAHALALEYLEWRDLRKNLSEKLTNALILADDLATLERYERQRANVWGLSIAELSAQDQEIARRLHDNLMLLLELLGSDWGSNGSAASGPLPDGTIIKADPASAFGLSSTAPSVAGVNSLCPDVAPWSMGGAMMAMAAGDALRIGFVGDCRGANWSVCKSMSDSWHTARDHLFQLFDQNHDGVANCRLCNYDAILAEAKKLVSRENWLASRYFYGANGLGNIFYTIMDNAGDPLCATPVTSPAASASAAGAAQASASGSGTSGGGVSGAGHICADPNAAIDARWKFYRYIYGGGGTAYPEKGGFICYTDTSYYTYQGQMEKYVCETPEMLSCRRDGTPPTRYSAVVADGDSTSYEYESGYAVRTAGATSGGASSTNPGGDAVGAAVDACSNVDITAGRAWRFAGNMGYSNYYEHNGHLCAPSTDTVLRIDGDKLVGYRCNANWTSCAAAASYDADLVRTGAAPYEAGGLNYTKIQVVWRGMNPRDLLIAR